MAKLHFYYSAMNAGKSTTLLQSDYNYRERGMHTILYTPSFDTRFEKNHVSSRIGLSNKAHGFDAGFDFLSHFKEMHAAADHKIAAVFVDEAHFLSKQQVEQLTMIVDYFSIPVLAYGLRTDFMGEPFEGSKYLLAWAEDLNEIKTICHCGRKATMNMRVDTDGHKVNEGDQVEIGGNDRYISTCRRHFLEGDAGKIDTLTA